MTRVDEDVRLTPEEQATWDEFVARHADEFRADMGRALTDDARSGWEGVVARREGPVELTPEDEFKGAMARALFDDVRPGWEHVA